MKRDKWVKRWKVKGSSGFWTVAVDRDGNYGCSCPVWKFRRQECHHIFQVRQGYLSPESGQQRPAYILANVRTPTLNAEKNELLIPLIALPDLHMMEATVCYSLLVHGYSMKEIRELRRIPSQWTARAIRAHVEQHGLAIYPQEESVFRGGEVR